MNNMWEILLEVLIIVLFVLIPSWGAISIAREVAHSRRVGKELDLVKENLKKNLGALQKKDISGFEAALHHWLADTTSIVKTPWLQEMLLLVDHFSFVATSESHRRYLRENEAYREEVVENLAGLANSIGNGNPYVALQYLVHLYTLLLSCEKTQERGEASPSLPEDNSLAIEALKESIAQYHKGELVVTQPIDDALSKLEKIVSASGTATESMGASLLILKWARREMESNAKYCIKNTEKTLRAAKGEKLNTKLLYDLLLKRGSCRYARQ